MRTTYVQAAMLEHVERELDATCLKLAAAEAELAAMKDDNENRGYRALEEAP